jgi:hypothetical protein
VEVKERLGDWTDDTVMRTDTTDLSLVLTGLEPLTRYNARVRFQNFNGFSLHSVKQRILAHLEMVTVTGSNGMVESGTTIILVCTQMLLTGDDTCITVEYTWSREGGQALPDGSMISNGEPSLSPSYLQPSLACPLYLNLTSYSTILHSFC